MPFPNKKFGIIDNPLIFSVFSGNNDGESEFSDNEFLLLDGEFFMLLDGTHFLLLGT